MGINAKIGGTSTSAGSEHVVAIDGYHGLQILREYDGRTIYRAYETTSDNLVLVTLLAGTPLSGSIPTRDTATILSSRAAEFRSRLKDGFGQNALALLEAGESLDLPYFVHSFRSGTSLRAILSTRGRLGFEGTLSLLADVSSALDRMHARGVFHGALCTDAILCDRNGTACIADLGTEYCLQPLLISRPEPAYEMFRFRSPERLRGGSLDRSSDLFSLGAIAFEAITAHSPFSSSTAQQLRNEIQSGHPACIAQFLTNVSPAADEVFARALSPNPKHRFSSAQEFTCALATALHIEPLTLRFGKRTLPKGEAAPAARSANDNAVREQLAKAESSLHSHGATRVQKLSAVSPAIDGQRKRLDDARKIGSFIGIAATVFVTATVLVAFHFNSSADSDMRASLPYVSISSSQTDSLESPRMELPTPEISIESMSDRQLLGAIWSNRDSVDELLRAFNEAKQRRLPELVNALVEPLHSQHTEMRRNAARLAGTLQDKRIVPFLLMLLNDPSLTVRADSAHSIGFLGSRKTLPFLVSRYRSERDSNLRQELKGAIDRISGYTVSEAELAALAEK